MKVPPPRFADSNPAYVEAQARALQVAREIFPDVEEFLEGDELHLKLARCALLSHATPQGLAEFASGGPDRAELISRLLSDDDLVVGCQVLCDVMLDLVEGDS